MFSGIRVVRGIGASTGVVHEHTTPAHSTALVDNGAEQQHGKTALSLKERRRKRKRGRTIGGGIAIDKPMPPQTRVPAGGSTTISDVDTESAAQKHAGGGSMAMNANSVKPKLERPGWMLGTPKLTEREKQDRAVQQHAAERAKQEDKRRRDTEEQARQREVERKAKELEERGAPLIGDGGASWRARAMRRARERAQDEGQEFTEVIASRHGTVQELRQADIRARERLPASYDPTRFRRGRHAGSRSYGAAHNTNHHDKYRRDHHGGENRDPGLGRKGIGGGDARDKGVEAPAAYGARPHHEPSRIGSIKGVAPSMPAAAMTMQKRFHGIASAPSNVGADRQKDRQSPGSVHAAAGSSRSSAATAAAPATIILAAKQNKAADKLQARDNGDVHAKVNRLRAKQLRAKMMKNAELAESLGAKIDKLLQRVKEKSMRPALQATQSSSASASQSVSESKKTSHELASNVVVLSELGATGRPLSLAATVEKERAEREAREIAQYGRTLPKADWTKHTKVNLPDKIQGAGQRVAYFDGDARATDLRTLVEEQKLRGGIDHDREYARNIASNSKFKEKGTDEQFDEVDSSMAAFDTRANNKRLTDAMRAEREREQQVQVTNRVNKQLERCSCCLESQRALNHLVVSMGVKMYLAIPATRIVSPGQCTLMPIEHTPSVAEFDEDVYEEYDYWRMHLVKMYGAHGQGVVFVEEVTRLRGNPHASISCIPLPLSLFLEAPKIVKHAINESDAEWSTHKKLIDTRSRETGGTGRGFRRAVPKQFPYISIEFGMSGGFAHVIEDEARFPTGFGLGILCGVVDEPAEIIMRAKRRGRVEELARKQRFIAKWKRYDWTRILASNSAVRAVPSSSGAAAGLVRGPLGGVKRRRLK